jgi:hypothetical protein
MPVACCDPRARLPVKLHIPAGHQLAFGPKSGRGHADALEQSGSPRTGTDPLDPPPDTSRAKGFGRTPEGTGGSASQAAPPNVGPNPRPAWCPSSSPTRKTRCSRQPRRSPRASVITGCQPSVSTRSWRCRESNPGPFRSEPVFYVRSRAVASQPPRFVRHRAVAAYSLFVFPRSPVTGEVGESPS